MPTVIYPYIHSIHVHDIQPELRPYLSFRFSDTGFSLFFKYSGPGPAVRYVVGPASSPKATTTYPIKTTLAATTAEIAAHVALPTTESTSSSG